MKILSFFIATILAAGAAAQTLEDYLLLAAENNPGIKAKTTEFQAALQKLPQAGALPDPEINASFFLRPMMLPMGNQLGSISVMQMFPWFGTLNAMENEAARMAEVKSQEVQVALNELFYKVKSAWYPLLELEEQIRIQRQLLKILETDKELATIQFQHGQAPMVDAIRADIMMDEVKTEIALLEQKRKPLEVAFNRLLDRDANTPVVIPGSLPEPLPADAFYSDSLLAANPALAVFDKRIQATLAELAVAEKMRKPMVGIGIQYMPLKKRKGGELDLPPNTGRDMVMPMFSITVPIWRKKYDAAVEERQLMQLMYADMKRDMENDLAAMFEMSLYEMGKSVQMVELLNTQMLKTQQAIDLLLAAYSNAGQDFEEVLLFQRQLFRYQSEKVSAVTEYRLTKARLDFLTGKNGMK